jgi:hypothetical protein
MFHRINVFIIDWIGYITFFIFVLLGLGLIQQEPTYFIEFTFFFKVCISIFLMYRFNDFRTTVKFTELDRKVCFLAGVNILFLSFADLIKEYADKMKTLL